MHPDGRPAGFRFRAGAHLAFALLVLLSCAGEERFEERESLRASLQPDSAGLGDPVTLRIEAIVPRGSKIEFPGGGAGDSIGGWHLLSAGKVERRRRGEWERQRRTYTVAAFRLGAVGPGEVRLTGRTPGGDSLSLRVRAPDLTIRGSFRPDEPVDVSQMKDIRGILSTGWPAWPWIVALALLLGIAGFLLLRAARRRKGRKEPVGAPLAISPEEEFEEAIRRLLASGILERGHYREFYYEVSRAVRLYLERKLALPLLESTSEEVIHLLAPRVAGAEQMAALRGWLAEGDMVKYARDERLQAEARRHVESARTLVRALAAGVAPVPEDAGGRGSEEGAR